MLTCPRLWAGLIGIPFLLGSGCLNSGCSQQSQPESFAEVTQTLRDAQFEGQFEFHTDGQVGGEMCNGFWLGARKAYIGASGTVNWSRDAKPEPTNPDES